MRDRCAVAGAVGSGYPATNRIILYLHFGGQHAERQDLFLLNSGLGSVDSTRLVGPAAAPGIIECPAEVTVKCQDEGLRLQPCYRSTQESGKSIVSKRDARKATFTGSLASHTSFPGVVV